MNLHMLDSENEEQYIWRLGQAKDSGELNMSWEEIAEIINMELGYEDKPYSEVTFRKPYQQAKKYYEAGVFDNKKNASYNADVKYDSSSTINKDGTYSSNKLIEMNEAQSKDPEYILEAHGFEPDSWTLVSARNNIRNVTRKDSEIVTLYASFITVKPIQEKDLPLRKIDEFFDRLDRTYSLPVLDNNFSYADGNKLLLIDIADLHVNLQSSLFTTGNEYNCDIAENLFFYVLQDIMTRTMGYNFEEIIFCIGGDMLNGDNLFGSTTKGTPQDSDLHYYDAYERLCAMTIKAVDLLKQKANAKISVVYVPGNHDEITGYKLAKFVDAWFRNDDRVEVDYSPIARKYKLYGKTLMCFAHDGNAKDLTSVISNEARQYWSQADTVEVFLQHMHSEQILKEDNNIRIQRLPTISARSKWSTDRGYGSKRQCKTFVFDAEDGLTDILYTPIKA